MAASVYSIFGKVCRLSRIKQRNNGAAEGLARSAAVGCNAAHTRRLVLSSRPFTDTRVARPHRLPRPLFLQQKSDIKLVFLTKSWASTRLSLHNISNGTLRQTSKELRSDKCRTIYKLAVRSSVATVRATFSIVKTFALFTTCRFASSNSHNQHLYLPLMSSSSAPQSRTPSASLSMRDQVSHPYKTTKTLLVLCFYLCC